MSLPPVNCLYLCTRHCSKSRLQNSKQENRFPRLPGDKINKLNSKYLLSQTMVTLWGKIRGKMQFLF